MTRFNNDSLEIAIAVVRVIALSALVATVVAIAAFALTFRPQLAITALLFAALTACAGYFGFWAFGNSSWSDDGRPRD